MVVLLLVHQERTWCVLGFGITALHCHAPFPESSPKNADTEPAAIEAIRQTRNYNHDGNQPPAAMRLPWRALTPAIYRAL